MEISVIQGDIAAQDAGAIVVNILEGVDSPGGATGAVDRVLGGAITQLIQDKEIRGKKGELTLLHTLGRMPSRRVIVAGLGKEKDLTPNVVRYVSAEAARYLKGLGIQRAATVAHGAGVGGLSPEESAQAIAEGTILGLYSFDKHKKREEDEKELKELAIVEQDSAKLHALREGVSRGRIIGEAVSLARDMINEPANMMTPSDLAERAKQVAGECGLEITVLDRPQMEELGMGAILGVARGSSQPPKFIVLRYWGDRGNPSLNLGLLGKGITFDSGGISLKPAEGMAEMKGDMAGGASVIAAIKAIAQLKAKINVTAITAATENMPGGSAQKPGDLVRAMSGKTIEVDNTDAEGRLVLADALSYARQIGLSHLVNVATLTGAMRVALGTSYTGAFTNNQELLQKLLKAGERAGERVWQLPLVEDYKEQLKSQVADLKNVGGRYGGAITAALFLSEFAQDTPWVHLDIAGTSMTDKEKGYLTRGSTGNPVRTLVNLALDMAQES